MTHTPETPTARDRIAAWHGVPAGLRDAFMTAEGEADLKAQAQHLSTLFPDVCGPPAFAANPGQGVASPPVSDPLAEYHQYYDESGRLRR